MRGYEKNALKSNFGNKPVLVERQLFIAESVWRAQSIFAFKSNGIQREREREREMERERGLE